jgi:hypothetical protein
MRALYFAAAAVVIVSVAVQSGVAGSRRLNRQDR